MTIVCKNCGKNSGIEATESFGKNAALAQAVGYIPKILVLYTNNSEDEFIACSAECSKVLCDQILTERQVSEEKKEEIRQMMAASKARIPQMAKETVEAVVKFHNALRELTKRK